MLQNKDIIKIQEIKTLFDDSWKQPDFYSQQIKLFKCTRTSKIFKSIKKCGVSVWELLQLLLVLPFTNTKTIHAAYTDRLAPETEGKKDIYYRLLANQKFNWRSLLLLFVKKYLKLDADFAACDKPYRCLIFDDTDIKKTGKKIEGVSKIFNHVEKTFILGYKLLVVGYWNGSVFIPVDFSFHREQINNKKNKYGLTQKAYKNQKKTERGKGSPAVRRFKELNRKKTQVVVEMFRRIIQRKIAVDYILMDSWFTSISLIKKTQASI